MKLAKQSSIVSVTKPKIGDEERFKAIEAYLIAIDKDITNLMIGSQSRFRFGDSGNSLQGENISGLFRTFTSSATAGQEFGISHTIGSAPVGRIILWQDKPASLSQGPSTGTSWTSSNVYFTCDSASVTFNVFLVK